MIFFITVSWLFKDTQQHACIHAHFAMLKLEYIINIIVTVPHVVSLTLTKPLFSKSFYK